MTNAEAIAADLDKQIAANRADAKRLGEIKFRVKKLHVRNGDFVLLAHDEARFDAAQDLARSIGQELRVQGKSQVVILVTGPGITLETLDEAGMRRAGWVKLSPEVREIEDAVRQLAEHQEAVKVGERRIILPK